MNRGYHALTTRYNVYFNGNEKLKQSEQTLYTGTVDDYQQIISIFPDGNESSAKEVASLLDVSIQKASKGIDRHSMRFKLKNKKDGKTEEREVNPFIDDCYLLLGKSYFYKREFNNAANTFEYIAKEYDKKKIKYDALIWLTRAYIADEKYEEARKIIDKLDNDAEIPKKKKGYYLATKAQYFIKTNDNKEAIKALNEALTFKAKKKLKTRWFYVLAQLQSKEGNKTEAIAAYKKVVSGICTYDMQFSAVIEMTKAQSEGNKSDDFTRSLLKMAKEEKNKEYLDEIYYTVAQIYHQNGDVTKATEYYLSAANKSVKNKKQKALAFLAVADINFTKANYLNAASYFDSSLTAMPADDALYEPTEIKKNNLKDLVVQIEIINTQDSLLTLAKMPEEARLKKIDKTIAQFIQEEDRLKEQELLSADAATKQNTINQSDQSGKWYFYNPSLISAGKAKFAASWGQRKLEDNWRRKNKNSAAFGSEDESASGSNTPEASADVKKTREYYLKDIPKTEQEIAASEEKLGHAYFALGTLYKDKMDDSKSSIVTFEEMNSKLPGNKNELKSYYLLYRMNLAAKNATRANYYKNLIETKYPSSEYLRLINNPNAAKEDEAKEKALSAQYEQLFNEYKKGNYAFVKEQSASLINDNPKGIITPQLALLNAFSVGKTDGAAAFTQALTKVKTSYAGSDAATAAQEILSKDDKKPALPSVEKDSAKEEAFEVKEESFYFVLIANEKDNNIPALQKAVSDFSTKYYSAENLQMQTVIWSENEKVIICKTFAKSDKAIDFYSTIPEKVLTKFPKAGNNFFPISISNYAKLFKNKNVEEYKAFFESSY